MTVTNMPPRVLVCYDGSAHANAAVIEAARLFPGARADVLVVVELGFALVAASGPIAFPAMPGPDVLADLQAAAHRMAEEGVELARDKGLDASPLVTLDARTTWHQVCDVADAAPYAAVVVGSRGRSAIRTALLGGVSMGVVTHCHKPVVVVHAAQPAASRQFDFSDEEVVADLQSHPAGPAR
jgi:nucleotide-binding universal stress UspA family protein